MQLYFMQTNHARIARRRAKIYLAAARLDRAQLPCRLRTFTPAPADIPERRAKIDFTPFSRRSFASLAVRSRKTYFPSATQTLCPPARTSRARAAEPAFAVRKRPQKTKKPLKIKGF